MAQKSSLVQKDEKTMPRILAGILVIHYQQGALPRDATRDDVDTSASDMARLPRPKYLHLNRLDALLQG